MFPPNVTLKSALSYQQTEFIKIYYLIKQKFNADYFIFTTQSAFISFMYLFSLILDTISIEFQLAFLFENPLHNSWIEMKKHETIRLCMSISILFTLSSE